MKNKKKYIKAFIVFISSIAIFTMFSSSFSELSLPKVKVVKAKSGTLNYKIRGEQNIEPVKRKKIRSDVTGDIEEILIEKGDSFSKNQNLFLIDTSNIKKDYINKNRNLESLKKSLEIAKEEFNEYKNNLSKNKREAIEELEKAKEEEKKYKELYEAGAISKSDYDEKVSNLKKAEKRADEAGKSEKLKVLRHQKNVIDTKISYEQSLEEVREIKKILDTNGYVNAKFDGTILEKNKEVGESINKGEAVLETFETKDGFKVKFEISKDSAEHIKKGEEIKLYVKDKKEDIKANVAAISTKTNNIKELTLNIKNEELKGDEVVEIDVKKKSKKYENVITSKSICTDQKGNYVWVVSKVEKAFGNEYKVYKKYIRKGNSDSERTVVLEGLSGYEDVVSEPKGKNLFEGARVLKEDKGGR